MVYLWTMGTRAIVTLSFLCFSLLVVLLSPFLYSPVSFISTVFNPSRAYLYGVIHASSQTSETEKLKVKIASLEEQLIKLKEVEKDNVALRSQFKDTSITSQKLLPARVLGMKGSLNNPSAFIVDQGSGSGVKKDMVVILKNVLVGKVSKVQNNYSEIILVTNKDFTTLGNSVEHNSPGVITGFEDFIVFDHVVITDTLSRGEEVVTKGEINSSGVGIPPGFVVGTITKVNKSESKPFQSALVKTPLQINKISNVFILSEN